MISHWRSSLTNERAVVCGEEQQILRGLYRTSVRFAPIRESHWCVHSSDRSSINWQLPIAVNKVFAAQISPSNRVQSSMSNRDEYAQIYEQSLQQARASLLHSTFDQFWIQSETCPLIQGKPSTETNDFLSDASRPPSRRFCRLCWKSPWSRSILIILPVLLLLLLSLPFIIRSQSRANHLLRQCSSLACLAASHRIVENLDLHRNPCENFFAYACGGWSNSRLLLPSETSTSYFKEIAKKNAVVLYELLKDNADTSFETAMKLKSFFNACMDRAANERTAQETLLRLLVQVGKSPILVRHWSPHHWNLLSSLVVTHQHKFHPLFRMSITVDEKNNQFHRIYLGQAGLSFEDTSLYHSEALRYLFNQIGTDLLQSLGYSSQSSAQLFHSMDEIFTFEQQLAHIFPRRHPINPWQSYHLFTFEQIHHYFHPWLDIGDYFERIFRKEKSFFYNQTILIGNPEYFERLSELIQTTPTHVLANYVTFQVIQEVWPYMPERFAQIRRPLLAHLKGVTEEKAWWEVCVKRTDDAFGFATGKRKQDRSRTRAFAFRCSFHFESIRHRKQRKDRIHCRRNSSHFSRNVTKDRLDGWSNTSTSSNQSKADAQ